MVTSHRRGQALVEFALVAPMLLFLLLVMMDFARGVFFYSEMAAAAREAGRQAVLYYNRDSNTGPAADCISPCQVPGVVPQIQSLAAFGYQLVFEPSSQLSSPPSYGSYQANADPSLPGTIRLSTTAQYNTVYVFVYELDLTSSANPRWDCADPNATKRCQPVRTSGHHLAVVDLQMLWRPVALDVLNLRAGIGFDAQTVERIEF